ncbi:hypothetical protein MPC4_170046 [Methylocella tundrae]|uniref:Uncharacterized protein n=1 Tax=Methylocella tundrae TaxID=227605 RepID=A0A8B6M405_METTU|nr:hypothetical protein MPC4_170046 [Methylocella tundrae]
MNFNLAGPAIRLPCWPMLAKPSVGSVSSRSILISKPSCARRGVNIEWIEFARHTKPLRALSLACGKLDRCFRAMEELGEHSSPRRGIGSNLLAFIIRRRYAKFFFSNHTRTRK